MNPAYLAAEPLAFIAGAVAVRIKLAALRERPIVVQLALAAASAAAAFAAGGAPTGWSPLDVLLRAGLGAGAVFACWRARPLPVLVCGLAAAVFGASSAALPLALAGSGLVLNSFLDNEEALNAAGAALVVQAALRLTSPGGNGGTALVAAVIVLALFVSALRGLGRGERRILARVGAAAAGLAFVGAVTGGVAAWLAADPLRRGIALAGEAVSGAGVGDPQSGVEGTTTQLASAGRSFADARRVLGAWWARPASVVPIVAQHWRVLHAAAISGDELASAGQRALGAPALADVRVSDGQIPLGQLAVVGGAVGELARDLSAGHRRLASARSSLLVPPVLRKLDTELVRVAKAETTAEAVSKAMRLLPDLLGRDGPRRYFLAVQTPAEARAGGGFIGNFGEITAENGRLTLSRFGRPEELNDAPGRNERKLAGPAEFVERYGRFSPASLWENINVSPDFPTDAQVIADLYPQSGGTPVDGVIAVDPSGLAALLRLVGAVSVPSWPTPVTADNAVQLMLYDQYVLSDRRERTDFLGDVAQETWRRLTTGVLPAPQQLLATLGPAVRTKHLLLWSKHAPEQELFDEIGASGRMAPIRGDFVGLVTQNAGANKIDYFLRRSIDYRVTLDPATGGLRATVAITLFNDAPPSGLPISVIGNQLSSPPLPDGYNKMYLSLYTPWEMLDARLDGRAVDLEKATELGRRVYSAGVVIPPKASVTLEINLAGRLPAKATYRLDLYRQPVVAADDLTTTIELAKGWRPAWNTSKKKGPATSNRKLEADDSVEFSLRRR